MAKRYCPMCEKWLPARETVCKACGMPTEKPEPARCEDGEVRMSQGQEAYRRCTRNAGHIGPCRFGLWSLR